MSYVISPNMNLQIPGVGTEAGPNYATDVNNSLNTIDAHNHAAGSGVQVTPAGLNINASLPLNNNSLTTVGAVTFQIQNSDAAAQSIYMKGVDFYLTDGSDTVIRLTQSGSVTGASGTITGLPSGTASASYAASVFTFQSATSTAANIDGASFVLRNNTASSYGLTLQPPNSLAGNYALTLPLIPSAASYLSVDTSGNITGSAVVIRPTGASVAARGVAISSSCGNFSTTSGTLVNVTNLSVTIVTTGNPVVIQLISDGSGNRSIISAQSGVFATLAILNGSTVISETQLSMGAAGATSISIPPGAVNTVDFPSAGTITYKVQIAASSSTAQVAYCKLVAYELT